MAELLPIRDAAFDAHWTVSVASETDPNDPWSGWTDVQANACTGMVEVDGIEYTPEETRNFAEALRRAALHAETFGSLASSILFDLICIAKFPEIDELPIETQRTFRRALHAAADRYERKQAKPGDTDRSPSTPTAP